MALKTASGKQVCDTSVHCTGYNAIVMYAITFIQINIFNVNVVDVMSGCNVLDSMCWMQCNEMKVGGLGLLMQTSTFLLK